MKVLVTGGAGFIGSHVCEELIRKGHTVTTIDNLSTGKIDQIPREVNFINCDLCKISTNFKDVGKQDAIIHLAAQTLVGYSVENPIMDARQNIMNTLETLELCKKIGAKDFRYISSAAVYGNPRKIPISESDVCNPISAYGISKLTGENYVRYFSEQIGLGGAIFRLANVYGPRQRNDFEGGVTSIFIQEAISGKSPTIYGDGKQTRDFVYVGDVARILVRNLGKIRRIETLNVSTSQQTSILDLWKIISEFCDRKQYEIMFKPWRTGDIYNSSLSNEKIMRLFAPLNFTDIVNGIRKTLKIIQSHKL